MHSNSMKRYLDSVSKLKTDICDGNMATEFHQDEARGRHHRIQKPEYRHGTEWGRS